MVIPHVCRPNDIVREAAPLLSRLVGEDIEVELRPRAKRSVFVDRSRLLQVIIGIAVHARDSMQAGGRITLSTQDEAAAPGRSRGHVLITITDTGVGVCAEARARLFEPQHISSRSLGWGTGLGLSFVHSIISRFGGTIQVDSVRGEGTTFTIRLPAIDPGPAIPLRGNGAPQALRGGDQ